VVLLHVLGERLDTGCYGIVSQGFPQLMRVGADIIRPDPGYVAPAQDPVICRVRLLNETPRVPDLERLERAIADETSVAQT
jgi:chemosensory pili system protein ChpC